MLNRSVLKVLFLLFSLNYKSNACLPPFICNNENGLVGSVPCEVICLASGHSSGTCVTKDFPTQTTCQCNGPREADEITDGIEDVYRAALPAVCQVFCGSCLTRPGSFEIDDTNPQAHAYICNCESLISNGTLGSPLDFDGNLLVQPPENGNISFSISEP